MSISADLNNPENWDLLYNETVTAGIISLDRYVPIQRFTIPVLADSPLLYCYAENLEAKKWWYLGYRLYQKLDVAVSPGDAYVEMKRVFLNRPQLVYFQNFNASYALDVEIPPWFSKMKVAVYSYSGNLNDSNQSFISGQRAIIQTQLDRIEAAIT